MVDVSIVCITYNHEKYIGRAIDSFIKQKTSYTYEVLIYDDASTDRNQEIIKQYAKIYQDKIFPVYAMENQYSKGIKVNQTFNLSRAKGRYIAICEGDDFWTDDNKIEIQVSYMENHPECFLTAHSGYYCNENGDILSKKFRAYYKDCDALMTDICSKWLFPTASIVYRNVEPLNKEIPFTRNAPCGDVPLVMYAGTLGRVHYFDKPMCVYRVGSISSVSLNNGRNVKKILDNNVRFINMLNQFDEYTGYEFKESTDKFRTKKEFESLVAKKNLKVMKSKRYREIYNRISIKKKFKMYLEYYFPRLWANAYRVYNKIKR